MIAFKISVPQKGENEIMKFLHLSNTFFVYIYTPKPIKMASIKNSKKMLNHKINVLIDEAYNVQLNSPQLKEKSDTMIDEIIEFRDAALSRLLESKTKKELSGFQNETEQKSYAFFQEIMNLHI
jgi:hypothetical protein